MIGELAVEALPADLPAFLHTAEADQTIGEFAREPDRSRGAGKIHDQMRDPAHFINIGDDGKVAGGPSLDALPPTRAAFDAALRTVGSDSTRAGYLPYAIIDGWQQLTKDFGYWRVLDAAIPRETNPGRRAWMIQDRARREALILQDMGVWAHFVGDASQPLHVSFHYDGWGDHPNPSGYTRQRVHAYFEGAFVRQFVGADAVRLALRPPAVCGAAIEQCVARYLAATLATVEPFYALQKAGGFAPGDPRGQTFAAERLAVGVGALRDLTEAAWIASAHASVGYPALNVDQVLRGGVDPYDALYGED